MSLSISSVKTSWSLISILAFIRIDFSRWLLLLPEPLEVIRMPQVNGNSNDVCVFHRLLDLDVFIREDLHLLAVVPETRVEAVEKDG